MTLVCSSRRWAWLLVGSLALNLFLAAAIVVHVLPHGDRQPSARIGPIDRTAARDVLSDPDRAAVDAIWAAHGDRMQEAMRGWRQARRDVEAALYADPFDRAALERAHTALAERSGAARSTYEALVLDLAAALPAEARQKYFEAGKRRGARADRGDASAERPNPDATPAR